jgi:hypothetical protein|tara:strand:- start:1699 stop:1887 length:189 start_codon:yes stop_codon:yes gene_type:complete
MKKHNFDIALISSTGINLGVNFHEVDVPDPLFHPRAVPPKGYMLEIGFFLFTFVYLYAPSWR